MRWVSIVLLVLVVLVQADLWLGRNGLPHVWSQRKELAEQRSANVAARERNARVQAEVSDLKEGLEMVEDRARSELGMLRPDEVLVQVTTRK
jgi:cell division protein FtsB